MTSFVLALNAGSSSIKLALFETAGGTAPLHPLWRGEVDGLGGAARFVARSSDGSPLADRRFTDAESSHEGVLRALLEWIEAHGGTRSLAVVGHRVVHGGQQFVEPVLLTDAVVRELEALTPLAPLHQPHSLSPVRALRALRPDLAQVACFDTAFHHTLDATAARYAIPRRYEEKGVRRYGFHGLSYEYITGCLADQAPALARGRTVIAHLGNGASLCAVRNGRSVDTTMGFTALDGLVMGTRCGSLDPGVVLYLQQQEGLSSGEVEHMLYHQSGLLGVSGVSADMRELLASGEPGAREAVDLFVFRIARETAALAGTLGGLDGLVFTAGIGEHAAPIRAAVAARLDWLGLRIDSAANARGDARLDAAGSAVQIWMLPTDEERVIARHAVRVAVAR